MNQCEEGPAYKEGFQKEKRKEKKIKEKKERKR